MASRKFLVVASALDLAYPLGCTPAWWQFLKALVEEGVEIIAAPYRGRGLETPWWRSAPNPCHWQGELFDRARRLLRRLAPAPPRSPRGVPEDGPGDRVARFLIAHHIRPRWRDHLRRILRAEPDIEALLFLTIPPNHLVGVPPALREEFPRLKVVLYDGDVPASLPSRGGFASGFRIYEGAELVEFDLVICNSEGGRPALEAMGARRVSTLHWGVDPDLFGPLPGEEDLDVFFYGHGIEFRESWFQDMVVGPAADLPGRRFAVRGFGLPTAGTAVENLPDVSFTHLRHLACRSRINLCLTREAHRTVFASSSCRPFELAAMERAMVTNPWEGLERWFEPGREILVAHSRDEATALYRDLIDHPDRRRALARAARARVLAEHTWRHRARELLALLAR